MPNVKVVVTPDLKKHPKKVHYNTTGQLKLGEYYADAFLEFVSKKQHLIIPKRMLTIK